MNLISARYLIAPILASLAFWNAQASAAERSLRIGLDHYSGTWLEVARRPMALTDGCVAGYSTYKRSGASAVSVEDGCRVGKPTGKLRQVHGDGRILDYGNTNGAMRVRYPFFIVYEYQILYKAADQSWFISADPQRYNLWIYSRRVPNSAELRRMVSKAKELGYDVHKLEFPAQ
ncbi:lipocalin family protein [Rhizobium grahamii]|uniref:Outer membrane lipoprotein Blc n=1 Tax=Rhizobium grahamii CCGE 502 TaxID=990285 RepID=S3HBS9_9HYPH|nr:lipocalin family protein [Rhizobium grahamii]EPE96152.1 outer membrane lipoprotein [Rhizobium grahamii CCGE 502]